MTTLAAIIPVLAAGKEDAIVAVIVFVITIITWISKLANSRTPKGPPVANRPRPQARPRDDRLQQEISIFVEDNVGRRNKGAPPRPAPAVARPQSSKSAQAARRPQGSAQPAAKRKSRPGAEMATRPAPVAENLGTGVKQHLSQHMTDRVTQESQQRVASRVEEKVAADLGTSLTASASQPSGSGAARAPGLPSAERFAELLRSPAGVQQAIVLNLILSPPPGRSGSHRR